MLKGIGREATYYYHPDHLGSVSVVSNHRGEPYERVEYLPFGEIWIEETDPATGYIPFRFTSKELDEETGLYYYGARYYEPTTSRWISPDPAGFELVNPMEPDGEGGWEAKESYSLIEAVNWYAYVSNNPVKYVDPSGNDQLFFGIKDYIGFIAANTSDPSLTLLTAALGDKGSQQVVSSAVKTAMQPGLLIAAIGIDASAAFITEHGDEIAAGGSVIAFATGNPIAGTALAYLALSIDISNATNAVLTNDDKLNSAIDELTGLATDYAAGKISGKVLKEAYDSLPPEVLDQIEKLGEFVGEQVSETIRDTTPHDVE